MIIHTYKTEGIILKRRNFGEADKLLTIFTRHYGKITCLAKGVRKLTSRKAASLELFNSITLFLAKGKNLDIVTETQILDSYSSWRKIFPRVCLAYQFCELADRFTGYNQAHLKIYFLLKQYLEQLAGQEDLRVLNLGFKKQLLEETGFGLPKIINNHALDRFIEEIIERKIYSSPLVENS